MTILPDVFIVPPYMKVLNISANNETLPISITYIYIYIYVYVCMYKITLHLIYIYFGIY